MTRHQDLKGTVREFTVHDSPPQNGVAERGMRTRAERARALLISSGLPRFLWEEAMKHSTWLQNRLPHAALESKTPYEARHGKKPHLAGIQEFGAAAYVKDLKAGKFEPRAQVGRFVGYDSESKGYRIYWRTSDESVTLSGGALSEGEMESRKVIQSTTNSIKNAEKSTEEHEQPFPTAPDSAAQTKDNDTGDEDQQNLGRGRRQRKPMGAYREIEESLDALVAHFEDFDDEDQSSSLQEDTDCIQYESVLVATHPSDPKTLDEGLRGPDGKHWEKALQVKRLYPVAKSSE